MSGIEDLLAFWFTTGSDQQAIVSAQSGLWWGKGSDAEVCARFSGDLALALAGDLAGWAETARGRLALVLLHDQITRTVHRGTPASFSGDAAALALTREGIALGHDRALRPVERVFLYMPFMHAEDRGAQAEGVASFEALAAEGPAELEKTLETYADFARRHRDIVERFGRFPHRNAVLGRASTAEEAEFLKQPGSSF